MCAGPELSHKKEHTWDVHHHRVRTCRSGETWHHVDSGVMAWPTQPCCKDFARLATGAHQTSEWSLLFRVLTQTNDTDTGDAPTEMKKRPIHHGEIGRSKGKSLFSIKPRWFVQGTCTHKAQKMNPSLVWRHLTGCVFQVPFAQTMCVGQSWQHHDVLVLTTAKNTRFLTYSNFQANLPFFEHVLFKWPCPREQRLFEILPPGYLSAKVPWPIHAATATVGEFQDVGTSLKWVPIQELCGGVFNIWKLFETFHVHCTLCFTTCWCMSLDCASILYTMGILRFALCT